MKSTSLILLIMSLFFSCDPGFSGEVSIVNNSNIAYEVNFKGASGRMYDKDSTVSISPKSTTIIFAFGGLGEGRDINCCDCLFKKISLIKVDSSLNVRNINKDDWVLVNKNRKRYSSKKIDCSYTIN